MKVADVIRETLADWGNEWVHYSDHPMLTISPKQFHQDPAGIYFFPATVVPTADMWRTKPFKYIARLKPDAKVLDIATITDQQIDELVDAAGVRERFDTYIGQYPPNDVIKKFRMAWERIRSWFAYENGKVKQYSSFNAIFRRLGWDAIFDDTGSIHSGEPQQLLVLNPRVLTNIRQERRKGSGFIHMQKVINNVADLAKKYGTVEVRPIRKPNRATYWTERDNALYSQIDITNPHDERNYASLIVYIRKEYPEQVRVSIRWASPARQNSVGGSVLYTIGLGQYDRYESLERLDAALAQIFDNAVSEQHRLPGPRVVGSGKDFRQKAGTNRSGKQPGRLVGSGKPMKVKSGFVG